MYLEIKTDDLEVIETLLKQTIQKQKGHRLFSTKLENGLHLLEIIEQKEEPPIS